MFGDEIYTAPGLGPIPLNWEYKDTEAPHNPRLIWDDFPVVAETDIPQENCEQIHITADTRYLKFDRSNFADPKFSKLLDATAVLFEDSFSSPPWSVSFIGDEVKNYIANPETGGQVVLLVLGGRVLGGAFFQNGDSDQVKATFSNSLKYDLGERATDGIMVSEDVASYFDNPDTEKAVMLEMFMAQRDAVEFAIHDKVDTKAFRSVDFSASDYPNVNNLWNTFLNDYKSRDLYRVLMLTLNVLPFEEMLKFGIPEVDMISWTKRGTPMASINKLLTGRFKKVLEWMGEAWNTSTGQINTSAYNSRANILWDGGFSEDVNLKDYSAINAIQVVSLPIDQFIQILTNWPVYKMLTRGEKINIAGQVARNRLF